jgi:serine/threonine-protein kinase
MERLRRVCHSFEMEPTETLRPAPGRARSEHAAPPPTPSEADSSRRHLGPYELLHRLGAGGMADVWAAVRRGGFGFHQFFAIKMIRADFARRPGFREMFLSEARLASKIRHTNVVQVLDLGEDLDTVYQAMPLVDGDSVAVLVRQLQVLERRLPISAALRMIVDAARGLHAAHEATDASNSPLSIVHLDVSPQNILVGVDGVAKVSDFGIARALAEADADHDTREISGKLAYVAPEQLEGKPLDRRVDVFSLGVVLYELLLGKRLFANNLLPRGGLPPLPPDVPADIAAVARKALATNCRERTPTTEALADELEAVAHRLDIALSAKEVGRLVQEVLGAAFEARRQSLLGEVDPTSVQIGDNATLVATELALPPFVARAPSRRLWVLASVVTLVVVGAAIANAWKHSGTAAPAAAITTVAEAASVARAEPSQAAPHLDSDGAKAETPRATASLAMASPSAPSQSKPPKSKSAPLRPAPQQPKFSRNPYAD